MKKLITGIWMTILIIIYVIGVVSCVNKEDATNDIKERYFIVYIDSCEYITCKSPSGDYGWIMTHKGNCKNSIHKCK